MRKIVMVVAALAMIVTACSEASVTPSTTVGPTTTIPGTTPPGTTVPGTTVPGTTPPTTRPPTTVPGGTTPGGVINAFAGTFDPSSITFVAALRQFDTCDGVLDYFVNNGLELVGPYGLGYGGYGYGWRDIALAAEGGEDSTFFESATTTAPAIGFAAGGYSESNVQVAGVDEPDVAKTDGDRILTLVDSTLNYVEIDGANATLRGSLFLEGWGHRFFMSGDRAFVFSNGDIYAYPVLLESRSELSEPLFYEPLAVIQEIDLSDPASMKVVKTLTLDGQYISARAIGNTVRVVVKAFPAELPFLYPSSQNAEQQALEANRRVIQESSIEDWLPAFNLVDGSGAVLQQGLLSPCDRVHSPAEFAGFETLSVLTLDLSEGLTSGDGTSVVASGETVYASSESLYVATNVWLPIGFIAESDLAPVAERFETAIHKFDITGTEPARYLASGSVPGHLINQFAMDEYEGNLRVATTIGAPWEFQEQSESQVTVLGVAADELVEIGSVGGMGRGERIFSVRFVGPTGYVVTFRQVDPLFVLDLRDPAAPAVTGELKVPGFSTYLHPLGNGMLLGVGREADDEGFVEGAKVSLFDVSDPANPTEVGTWTGPGYSEVEWDHLAFTYWAPESAAFLPIMDYQTNFHGALVLKTDDGLREFGRIVHEDDGEPFDSGCEPIEGAEGFGEGIVQVCGETDPGGAPGHICDVFPPEELQYILEEFAGPDVDPSTLVGPGERVEICWPHFGSGRQVLRSIVIGDVVWTVSYETLQGNTLADLAVVEQIRLG